MSNKHSLEKVQRVRTALLLEQPFFGTLALKLKLEEAPWLPVEIGMAVDGQNLYFNADYVKQECVDELKGTICHEVLHCALGHIWRKGDRELERWNHACDYAVNPLVIESGLVLPGNVLLDDDFRNMPAETVYTRLGNDNDQTPGDQGGQQPGQQPGQGQPDPNQQGQGQGQGQPDPNQQGQGQGQGQPDPNQQGQGQGQGQPDPNQQGQGQGQGQPDPNQQGQGQGQGQPQTSPDGRQIPKKSPSGPGAMMDPPPGQDGQPSSAADNAKAQQEWNITAAQAAQSAKAAGNLSGALSHLIKDQLEPKADWEALLREYMTRPARDDYSWARPNSRFISKGLYLPRAYSESIGRIVVFIDSSGSVNQEILTQFVSEVNSILEDLKPESVDVITIDTEVNGHAAYNSDDLPIEIEVRGRGGTRYQPAFDYVDAHFDDPPDCALYFTDMMPSDGTGLTDPGYPLIWCDFSGTSSWLPSFGDHVVIQ